MRTYIIGMITLILFGLAASAQAADADNAPDPGMVEAMAPAVAADADTEIVEMVEMMEMLKLMEILKEMELIKDYDLFAEEETDEDKN